MNASYLEPYFVENPVKIGLKVPEILVLLKTIKYKGN